MSLTLASTEWSAIGTVVRVVVTEERKLDAAQTLLQQEIAALDLACSRFRPDSEVSRLARANGRRLSATPLLREAVRTALDAAERTGGLLDPTLGGVMSLLGYDRDFALLPAPRTEDSAPQAITVRRRSTWRDVLLDEDSVRVPPGVVLDLGATAKALGADRAATRISDELGTGVLVSLGGDIRVAGPAPEDGWSIAVQDTRDDEGTRQTVAITKGAMATSSINARRWRRGGDAMHHILDPGTLTPVSTPWRTVSAVAQTCVAANILTTTGIIRGVEATRWLTATGAPARLVHTDGTVTTVNGWPV